MKMRRSVAASVMAATVLLSATAVAVPNVGTGVVALAATPETPAAAPTATLGTITNLNFPEGTTFTGNKIVVPAGTKAGSYKAYVDITVSAVADKTSGSEKAGVIITGADQVNATTLRVAQDFTVDASGAATASITPVIYAQKEDKSWGETNGTAITISVEMAKATGLTVTKGTANTGCKDITFSKAADLTEGDTVTVTIVPDSGYKAAAPSIAYDGGTVTPTAAGTNKWTFTMPAKNVTVTETCTALAGGALTLTAGTGGSMTATVKGENKPSGGMVSEGDTVSVTITPDKGKTLATLTLDSTDVKSSATRNANGTFTYSFTMGASASTVAATFGTPATSALTLGAATNGSYTVKTADGAVSSGDTVTESTLVTITAKPDEGFEVASMTVDGAVVSVSGNVGTFSMPAAAATITVNFQQSTNALTDSKATIKADSVTSKGVTVDGKTITFAADADKDAKAVVTVTPGITIPDGATTNPAVLKFDVTRTTKELTYKVINAAGIATKYSVPVTVVDKGATTPSKPDTSTPSTPDTSKPENEYPKGTGNVSFGDVTTSTPTTPELPEQSNKLDVTAEVSGDFSAEDKAVAEKVEFYAADSTFPEGVIPNIKPNKAVSANDGFALDITFVKDGATVQPANNAAVTVAVPIPAMYKDVDANTLMVFYFDGSTYTRVSGVKVENGMVKFTANHFSTYVISNKNLAAGSNSNDNANPSTGVAAMAAIPVAALAGAMVLVANKKRK